MNRADWTRYLHERRAAEFRAAFGRVPDGIFDRALEVGAGDGFQSGLLGRVARRLVCTEYHLDRLGRRGAPGVDVVICDAERVGELFRPGSFDLVFSSNVLEHLPDVDRAIEGMHRILEDDGVMVHAVPNRLMKLAFLAFRYVDLARAAARRLSGPTGEGGAARDLIPGNNPKVARAPRSRRSRLLWPDPHGASSGHVDEFLRWGARRWEARFERAGFRVVRRLRGPLSSGYGLGLDRVRSGLEALGLGSEHLFVLVKSGRRPARARYWMDEAPGR